MPSLLSVVWLDVLTQKTPSAFPQSIRRGAPRPQRLPQLRHQRLVAGFLGDDTYLTVTPQLGVYPEVLAVRSATLAGLRHHRPIEVSSRGVRSGDAHVFAPLDRDSRVHLILEANALARQERVARDLAPLLPLAL